MSKNQSLFRKLKTKSVKINIGERTFKMRLLTLSIFALAVIILLIAIIVLIIVNICSGSSASDADLQQGAEVQPTSMAVIEPTESPEAELEPLPDEPDEDIPEETPEPVATPDETPSPSPASGEFSGTIKVGDTSEVVKTIQQRLVDLYYMDYPIQANGSYSVTNKFGSATSNAVKLFQERNGLTANGECDEATYKKLMSSSANSYIMKQNDKCDMVKVIQTKLKEKGFLDKVTGFCGNDTITAVTNFQKANGLTPDGIAGPGTLKLLFGH